MNLNSSLLILCGDTFFTTAILNVSNEKLFPNTAAIYFSLLFTPTGRNCHITCPKCQKNSTCEIDEHQKAFCNCGRGWTGPTCNEVRSPRYCGGGGAINDLHFGGENFEEEM